MLQQHGHKYRLDRLFKRGDVLYAPYKCELSRDAKDYVNKILLGPRADLIGSDKMLVFGQRGVRLYATGFYKAADNTGHAYYADSTGAKINKNVFENILGL